MLEPTDRRLFLEALRPPDGYVFDRAVGTTFTLDLAALMAAPLAFTFFDVRDTAEGPKADPLHLLDAVRRHADRIHLFCQAGQIAVPAANRPLFAFLESVVVEVRAMRKGHLFHPKVWVVRYLPSPGSENEDSSIRYRVLVMSRNLTFDRSWDALVCLDGKVLDRKNAIADNHPLGDFVAALPGLALRPLGSSIKEAIAQVEHEVRRTEFELPEGVDSVGFHPLGLERGKQWPLGSHRVDRALVISPFVSASFLSRARELGESQILIARTEELARMPAKLLHGFEGVHVVSDAAFPELSDAETGGENALVGLHAKIFVTEAGREAHLYLGSANASDGAWSGNVEFMVELVGKKSLLGVEAILGRPDQASSLRSMLRAFAPGTVQADDPVEEKLRVRLEALRATLADARLSGSITPRTDGSYDLALRMPLDGVLDLGAGMAVRVWPATLAETLNARPLGDRPEAGGILTVFEGLQLRELTSFFAFHAVAEDGPRRQEIFFSLNLPLAGDPEDRKQEVLRTFLDNPRELLRYLLLLLGRGGTEAIEDIARGGKQVAGTAAMRSPTGALPLTEALIRALHEDPTRIDEVERVVQDLAKTTGGSALLPKGFERVWEPILAARRELAS